MIYLFAAYTVVWVTLFVYVMSISGRQKKLDEELRILREMVDKKK